MLAGMLLVGGYFAFLEVEPEKASRTPQALLTDPEPEQGHAQRMPAPQVSPRFESLPPSQSTMVFTARKKDASSNVSSNSH